MPQNEPNPSPPRRLGRAARSRALRMRVAALTVALFIAAWVVISVQLASDHDPALSKSSTTLVATRTTGSSGTSTTGTSTGASTTSTSSSSPTPVTTSQS